jgi:hypothetical protein
VWSRKEEYIMKKSMPGRVPFLGFVLAAAIAGQLWANGVEVGDSREEVVQEVGEPRGTMLSLRMETLFYERGTVTLRDGT